MGLRIEGAILIGLLLATTAQAPAAEKSDAQIKTDLDKVSYCMGVQFGKQMKSSEIEINSDIFLKAIEDVYADRDLAIGEEEIVNTMREYRRKIQEEQAKKRAEALQQNIEEGRKFLEENAKKEGVKTLPSGVQYKVLEQADGPKPSLSDTVKVHYTGRLIDGNVFDSSVERGEPATFPLTGVIKGWAEGVQLMPVGSKYMFYIPSELGYGERGSGRTIPPNSTLIFEVELLGIEGK